MLTIYVYGGDYDLEEELDHRGPARSYVASTGLTPNGMLVAAQGDDTAIDATLAGTMTARAGDTNSYYLTLNGADIETALLPYVDQVVWKYVEIPGTMYKRWEPIRVKRWRT